MNFIQELRRQRWDDHRFYHHNRVNQSLHLLSAFCFLASYGLLFISSTVAVMVGWLMAMIFRQIGHFFFEPKTFDQVNNVSHDLKESIKVGYNLKRKLVLLSVWLTSPLLLLIDNTLLGLLAAPTNWSGLADNISMIWLFVGLGALLVRTIQLFFIMSIQSGLVWFIKILSDPIHDIYIYAKAPLFLMRGESYDPMTDWYIPAFVRKPANS